jgi:tetratricopeptide (TPR) repeat protein
MLIDSGVGAKLRAAITHHRRGDLDTAIATYREIVAAHPDHTQALQLLGQAHLRRRDIEAAADCFRRILALEPKNLRARECLGDVEQWRRDFDAAREAYVACLIGQRDDGDDARRLDDKLAAIVYAVEHLRACPSFVFRADLLVHAMHAAPPDGLVLELGVAGGHSLRVLAALTTGPVYGFDSFQGLPADWQPGFPAGRFAQDAPPVDLPGNAPLVIGLFEDTLPQFCAEHAGPIRLLHVDCDLYASTKTIFDHLGDRLVAGSVIVFDEYFNYPGWRDHEYRAFGEFVARTGARYDHIGWIPGHMQVAVQLG